MRLLIAASGTGGHLFPALAVAQRLPQAEINWLGVPNRLEQTLVPQTYPLHLIPIEGFQQRFSLKTLRIFWQQMRSIWQVKKLLKTLQIEAVFTTGGYIAAPAILAAKLQGIPVILHESNAIPGKVTRLLAPLCHTVAIGFQNTARFLPPAKTRWVSTPVRDSFLTPQSLDFPIPPEAPLIVVMGGSQGAVALNRFVRLCAESWLKAGAYIVHLTGEQDPDVESFQHPHYFPRPFYNNMAGLLQRANLAISRAGAGTLTELAVTQTPAILIPYPYAAEDHQYYNAIAFEETGAAQVYRQKDLTPEHLEQQVLDLLKTPQQLTQMAQQAAQLAVLDSAEQLVQLLTSLQSP
ncbi:undecaprenyldiphospho-muramoylpentapeptide beta-N-acetylglucosaminyltransferase [Spirulina subsalsa]|uniref:undecaprenyldiphospho-muramoylpentapeptide beta-N-acetylglucosaminyltransferase n=1 Tax=Spirulina subsalsa TaxID=54311 RepID=UPI0002FD3608|nr:undecaprenyldiphospho-muramoylpentapeptide beta-N-acetylglucosaminyltransferase [Spirulina subsalsa]